VKARVLDLGAKAWAQLPMGARRRILSMTNHTVMIGSVGLIHDPEGRVLLLEHRFRPPYPWGLPGGFLQKDEPPEVGLERELLEETGLVVKVDPVIFDAEYNIRGGYVALTLLGEVVRGEVSLSSEITSGGFFDPLALPAATYPHHASVIARWLRTRRSTS
jgi:8-oxo-dGTP diphosphatase